jgi:hypothetical protein
MSDFQIVLLPSFVPFRFRSMSGRFAGGGSGRLLASLYPQLVHPVRQLGTVQIVALLELRLAQVVIGIIAGTVVLQA